MMQINFIFVYQKQIVQLKLSWIRNISEVLNLSKGVKDISSGTRACVCVCACMSVWSR